MSLKICSLTGTCAGLGRETADQIRDFPGGPVAKESPCQCWEHGFDPSSGRFHMLQRLSATTEAHEL